MVANTTGEAIPAAAAIAPSGLSCFLPLCFTLKARPPVYLQLAANTAILLYNTTCYYTLQFCHCNCEVDTNS